MTPSTASTPKVSQRLINIPNLNVESAPVPFVSFSSKGPKVADLSDQKELEEKIWNLEQDIEAPTPPSANSESYNFSEYLITPQKTETETYDFAENDLQTSTTAETTNMAQPLPFIESQVEESQVVEPQVAEPQVAESQVAESQVAESQVAEPQVAESQVAEPQVATTQAKNQSTTDSVQIELKKPSTIMPKEIAPEPITQQPMQVAQVPDKTDLAIPKTPVVKNLARGLQVFQNQEKQIDTEIDSDSRQSAKKKDMSASTKVGIGLGIATLLGGGYWYFKHKK